MFNLPVLLLQACVIIALARAVGWLFRRMHQPQVIGEMLAGIMLGPSLLGWLAPDLSATLFPPAPMGVLSSSPRETPVSRVGCGGPQIKIIITPSIPKTRPMVLIMVAHILYPHSSLTRIMTRLKRSGCLTTRKSGTFDFISPKLREPEADCRRGLRQSSSLPLQPLPRELESLAGTGPDLSVGCDQGRHVE